MALKDIVRSGVAIANTLTSSLQDTVLHEAWTGLDAYGKPTYAASVSRLALVEMSTELRRMPDGQEVMQRAKITFIVPISANGASGRREPIDPRDRFTLPDGTTGPVLTVNGLVDPDTNHPYLYEVGLG